MHEAIIKNSSHTPQVKICGLTRVDEAIQCAELGADAIGLVFFEKSPRNVTLEQAKEISLSLPENISTIGVFVNKPLEYIMERVEKCSLNAVQLHSMEGPDLVNQLIEQGLIVIKCLYLDSEPFLTDVSTYNATGYLVECAKGILPGGNALSWDWARAKAFGIKHPFILAGGLNPENISRAIDASLPDAVDISSGVEKGPGRKDMTKIKAFIKAVSKSLLEDKNNFRRIF
ncbi:MAG: phosphoribosylanthranilate isomerase [Desulfobacula sp.]|jgi:phosphoribosylanthranilate isomerase|nr:phosphoribosylanthranilate isomerase [Desulfobacula sp.]